MPSSFHEPAQSIPSPTPPSSTHLAATFKWPSTLDSSFHVAQRLSASLLSGTNFIFASLYVTVHQPIPSYLPPLLDVRLAEARKKKSPLRMVSIANPGAEEGISQYTVLLDANAKVQELSSTSPDDPLAALNDAVRAAPMPQLFPDSSLKKMPRLGTLSCSSGNQQCTFTLLSVAAAARVATLE
jgi:hypothetical protein